MLVHRSKPATGALNRNDPLTRGLASAVMFRDHGGGLFDSAAGAVHANMGGVWSHGRYGPELTFASSDTSYVDLAPISVGNRFTIAMLGNTPNATDQIMGSRDPAVSALRVDDGGRSLVMLTHKLVVNDMGAGTELGTGDPALNVFVKRDDTVDLYKNGTLFNSLTDADNVGGLDLPLPWMLGGVRTGPSSRLFGNVTFQMVAIWSARALSAAEIARLAGDPFAVFRPAPSVVRYVNAPSAGWHVYGGPGRLTDQNLDTPIASVASEVASLSIDTAHRPADGEEATYIVRRADDQGRVGGGLARAHVQNSGGALRSVPAAPAWPRTPGWSARRVDGGWMIVAAWGAPLNALDIDTVELVEQAEGQSEQIAACEPTRSRTGVLAWLHSPAAHPVRYRVRATTTGGGTIDSPWSRWMIASPDSPVSVAPL